VFLLASCLLYLALTRSDAVAAPVAAPASAATSAGPTAGVGEIAASGYVVARRRATVAAEVTGRLIEVRAEEGAFVTAGQVLAILDSRLVLADLAVARTRLQASRASIAIPQADEADLRAQLQRTTILHQRGFVTEADFASSKARLSSLEAQIGRARVDAATAQAEVDRISAQLTRYEIRAPFSGIITSRNAQAGEIISPVSAGGGFTRTGVCTIVDMSSLEIEVDVNESFIGRIVPGQRARVTLDAYPGVQFEGRVIGTMATAIRERAAITVRVAFSKPDPRILPEMAARVAFRTGPEEKPS
jgi:RND family efflux transporter MFP subunit